jgi:uroporphyrinogen III methyltransferase/synthase
VIERGTFADQRVVTGTLATIASEAAAADVRAPSIAVIGPVAAMRERLRWSELRPLADVSVAVTRARNQVSALAATLRALGASVIEAPAIRIVPLGGPAPDLSRYDLLIVTSPNGVRLLFERLEAAGRDARALASARVAAIGPGTAAALRQYGVVADIVPNEFLAEGLVDALREVSINRALLARAADARDVLPQALRERGVEVDVLELYETVAEPLSDSQLTVVQRADYLTFTSSSTVRFFLEAAGDHAPNDVRIVSIGPVTSAALRERGLEPDVEATRHDVEGLVDALVKDAGERRNS